jgi:hypothetical protein
MRITTRAIGETMIMIATIMIADHYAPTPTALLRAQGNRRRSRISGFSTATIRHRAGQRGATAEASGHGYGKVIAVQPAARRMGWRVAQPGRRPPVS